VLRQVRAPVKGTLISRRALQEALLMQTNKEEKKYQLSLSHYCQEFDLIWLKINLKQAWPMQISYLVT
jgi:hypothetical protein